MKIFSRSLLIFFVFTLLISPLFISDKKSEGSLGEDEEIVWTIDLINRYYYEATILTRMKKDTLYFLIDSTATEINVSDPENEVKISYDTISSKEELKDEAIRTKNKELGETFKEYLNEAIVLKMRIKRSDVEKLPLIIRIKYNGVPEDSDESSGFVNIYKNKININFEDPQEKISRFYLILPKNFDIWFKNTKEDNMNWVDERIRLMWKNSERDIKHIKICAGTQDDRIHWENKETFARNLIIALISMFLGIMLAIRFIQIKKFLDYGEKRETILFWSLIIFCICIGIFSIFYVKDFPIKTHLPYWTLFALLILIAIYFGLKRFYERYMS